MKNEAKTKSEEVAVYSAISSGIEVSIGSLLHGMKVPLKGHIMAMIQNLLLIQYSKVLNSFDLISISFITASLKIFSPLGPKLKPMIFIFIQGTIFALPQLLFGTNYLSLLVGSFLMITTTTALNIFIEVILFGGKIIDAYMGFLQTITHFLNIPDLSFQNLIFGIALINGAYAFLLALTYYSRIDQVIQQKWNQGDKARFSVEMNTKQNLLLSMRGALSDITRPKFILGIFLTVLFIFFFSGLSKISALVIFARSLMLSWVGFVVARKIDYELVIKKLRSNGFGATAENLEKTIKILKKES